MSEDEKVHHVLALNLNRRHLSREQRVELEKELRERGWTYQRIAESVGVSKDTVQRDISTFSNEKVNRVVGKDGKSRPAVYSKDKRDQKRA